MRKIRAPERSNGRFGALFLLSEVEKYPKILVYFLRFFALQRTTKKVRPEGIEPFQSENFVV